ncbi:response regulator [Paraburkholderia sp.]|uniref:hybrid sensor histidine kinase/response regulator n=1 Tax=Paraburkholderia sp. TaxID=1926495 RepID=UPI00238241F6|nr:response regulator [Paraburkholderia sp.]MDE1181838.1 response regulator [Paraburkholderia sp.]
MMDWSRFLILNVDDNEGARYAKSRILSRAGFRVIEAASGGAALDSVRMALPDLVVLDVKLPDINGLDVCRRIKSAPETSGTLVVQTSAAAVESIDRVRGLENGADAYLTEPMEPAELIAQVHALLRVRLAETALRESEERFRQLAENIDDVFWMLDPATHSLLYLSPAYRRLWDAGDASVAPDPKPDDDHWVGQIFAEDKARVAHAYRALIDHGTAYEIEYRIRRAGGDTLWVGERGFPVHDARGRRYRVAGIVNDISERKITELRLREADRRKDEFLAMLAHELRNPLAPIQSAVELLRPERRAETAQFENARAIIERQVRHLSRLVDDLLDVARITQGKITLRQETVELSGAIKAAIETAQPALIRKRHQLMTSLPPTSTYLTGDSVRIAQVLGNLLSNAAKYTPEGGEIEVDAQHVDDTVRIVVRDNGIGIAADVLSTIFELFVQSKDSLERSEGGLGIGLPLARALLELHGGHIEAHSPGAGQGSEFVVVLPVMRGQPAIAPDAVVPAVTASNGLHRVLLVDDNVDAALAMSFLLESEGFDVKVAHDGVSALEMAASFEPEVLLLDIGLPGMDGYALARAFRERPGTRNALMIAITGYGQSGDRASSREAGFDLHLTKPVSFDDLADAVRRHFDKANAS